ncbi:N-acetyltransferase MAK3-like protein [Globomyces pollinis-pini]|nr:N-acetyltransferase MAK3-like protein [Globomyces pollinis-pini]
MLITTYKGEIELDEIMALIDRDLSEPYTIYTYRYFLHNWPSLTFLASTNEFRDEQQNLLGVIICRLEPHRNTPKRGYIAMLAVDSKYRKQGIGSKLVVHCIEQMKLKEADEIVLETELTNQAALNLYSRLGFMRDKRLARYYLNGVDAFRLKLWLK